MLAHPTLNFLTVKFIETCSGICYFHTRGDRRLGIFVGPDDIGAGRSQDTLNKVYQMKTGVEATINARLNQE